MNELPPRAETVIVGGGVIGLAIARELGQRGGGQVVLLERGELGAESSWAAAGMLAPQVEADRFDAFFALASASRDAYPAFARELFDETGIDIELEQTGALYLAFTDEDERECARRFDWQTRAGLHIERLTGEEARTLEPQLSERVRMALHFPLDGQVENRRLVAALNKSCETRGVRSVTGTEAKSLLIADGRVRGVETSRGVIETGAVVVAGGAWSSLLPLQRERNVVGDTNAPRIEPTPLPCIKPVRGQMLCFAPTAFASSPLVRHVVYSPRGYLVPRRDGRLLAGTTTEHAGYDKRVTDEGRRAIMAHAREIAPGVDGLRVSEAWAGLRPHGADGWPLIGAAHEARGLFYATAHYRNGILLAPLTGALVADMLLHETMPELLRPFALERLMTRACGGQLTLSNRTK